MICAPSEDPDQTGHPSSLTKVFAVRSVGSYKDPRFLHADSDDWDQTALAYLSIRWVNRSFCWICHAAAHSSFTMARVQGKALVGVLGAGGRGGKPSDGKRFSVFEMPLEGSSL